MHSSIPEKFHRFFSQKRFARHLSRLIDHSWASPKIQQKDHSFILLEAKFSFHLSTVAYIWDVFNKLLHLNLIVVLVVGILNKQTKRRISGINDVPTKALNARSNNCITTSAKNSVRDAVLTDHNGNDNHSPLLNSVWVAKCSFPVLKIQAAFRQKEVARAFAKIFAIGSKHTYNFLKARNARE